MKKYRNGKWYDEEGNETKENNNIDFSKPISINFIKNYTQKKVGEKNMQTCEDVDNHNKKIQDKIYKEEKEDLEKKTYEVLKYNDLL